MDVAYIDPTAGGMLLQIVFGSVTAFFVIFWKRIVGFFKRKPGP